jgi:GNAT superfamily N-acetyltransferase
MAAYQVTRLDVSDQRALALLRRLHEICLPHDELPDFTRGEWWIAARSGEAVAFAGMVPSAQWLETAYLVRAGVVPDHRGQGLQKRLIRVRLARARAHGWRWAITYTWNNPPSANALIACGFKSYQPRDPWASETVNYWRREL